MNPAAYSAAACAVLIMAWNPPLALLSGAVVLLLFWAFRERKPKPLPTGKKPSYFGDRGLRTSRLLMILRMFALTITGVLLFGIFIAALGVSAPVTVPLFIIVVSAVGVLIYLGFTVPFANTVVNFLFGGRSKKYDRFKESGGDFFDALAPPFNFDDPAVSYGEPEPDYSVKPFFRPQSDWPQCRCCGAKADPTRPCWYCGYNAIDGRHWRYECGCCGVRVPNAYDRCWYCGFGAEDLEPETRGGDGTAPID